AAMRIEPRDDHDHSARPASRTPRSKEDVETGCACERSLFRRLRCFLHHRLLPCARRVGVLRVTFLFDPLSYVGRAVRQGRAMDLTAGEKADTGPVDDPDISKVEHNLAT